MTLSIAARCKKTGMFGVAITSSSISVGSRCAWVRAKVGAVLSQNITNPALGIWGLDYLASGFTAQQTLDRLLAEERYPAYRQVLLIDRLGNTAHHTGEKALGIHNHATEENCLAAGNLLANLEVPQAMVSTFAALNDCPFPDRLLTSLMAGVTAGGELGALHSAALLVVDQAPWAIVDLRVDWDDSPVETLQSLWNRYEPQMQDYLTRALNPHTAPSYGVPGDL